MWCDVDLIKQLAIRSNEARTANCVLAAVCMFTNQTSCYSYKRKLKAAKAMKTAAMVTSDNQKSTAVVPGTNKYTIEGSGVTHLKIIRYLQHASMSLTTCCCLSPGPILF